MGYACPVCRAEQADAVHLANHLAITASLDRRDHRVWLEERAPDWADCGPEELGEIVSQHAPEIETPEFETGPAHDHGRPAGLEDELARQSRQPGRGAMSAEAEGVLEEARELTRQMAASDESAEARSVEDDEAAETAADAETAGLAEDDGSENENA